MNSASYIIWHEALQCSLAPLTWGIDFFDLRTLYNNKGVESGIAFHVIGNWIRIEYNEAGNNFNITFIPDGQGYEIVRESVLLQGIVPVIDGYVRETVLYKNRHFAEIELTAQSRAS